MIKNILYLEKRGCNFWKDEKLKSDVGNYRLDMLDQVPGKDGRSYFIEFSLWRDRGHSRKTYKNNPEKKLKKPVFVVDIPEALAIRTSFYTDDGSCYGNLELERKLYKMNFEYTMKDILKAANYILKPQYDKIVLINCRANFEDIPFIKTIAGNREKNVLDNLAGVDRVEYNPAHQLYHYYDEAGNGFIYDHVTKKIVG